MQMPHEYRRRHHRRGHNHHFIHHHKEEKKHEHHFDEKKYFRDHGVHNRHPFTALWSHMWDHHGHTKHYDWNKLKESGHKLWKEHGHHVKDAAWNWVVDGL